jgi:hypothetical protein
VRLGVIYGVQPDVSLRSLYKVLAVEGAYSIGTVTGAREETLA